MVADRRGKTEPPRGSWRCESAKIRAVSRAASAPGIPHGQLRCQRTDYEWAQKDAGSKGQKDWGQKMFQSGRLSRPASISKSNQTICGLEPYAAFGTCLPRRQ